MAGCSVFISHFLCIFPTLIENQFIMKPALFFTALAILCAGKASAQSCDGYFPMKPGSMMETTTYNEKGKLQSVSKVSIVDVYRKGDDAILSIHADIADEKGKALSSTDYEARCEKNAFSISMKSMISAEQMKNWKDMTVSIEADDLEYPADCSVGQKLKDAHLKINISMNGMNMPGTSIDVTEREVKAIETITTPAGTFECVKITSKQKVKNIIGYEMNGVEWISKGNGIVRTESYKGDKMKGYSELTKFTK